jgi:hypothetical protein
MIGLGCIELLYAIGLQIKAFLKDVYNNLGPYSQQPIFISYWSVQ